MPEPSTDPSRPSDRELVAVLDAALGLVGATLQVLGAAGRAAGSVSAPVIGAARRISGLLPGPPPSSWLHALARRGEVRRESVVNEASDALDVVVPAVVAAVLQRLDLTQIVHDHVDVERIVDEVDLDAVAARLDVDAVAARLDLEAVLARVDLDAVVARVDLDAVARRLDLDGLVATVDLDAVAARLDVEAVIDRVDLVGLAETIVAGIDLPEIIRDSTGVVASDTVREVRMQSISGDDAVARVVDRLLLRHHDRRATRTSSAAPTTVDDSVVASPERPGTGARPG
jgi:hypothetical protein